MAIKFETASSRRRVAIVLAGGASMGSGGTGRRFGRLFRYMQERQGYEYVHLITTRKFFTFLNEMGIEISGRNVAFLPDEVMGNSRVRAVRLAASVMASMALASLSSEKAYGTLHFVLPYAAFLPFLLLNRNSRIVFSMTRFPGAFRRGPSPEKLAYGVYLRRANAIDTLYESVPLKYYPHLARKMRVTPCSFTDYSRYLGNNKREKIIVFAGRLDWFKNPMLLLQAAHLCGDLLRTRGWKIAIFGKGPMGQELNRFIDENRLWDLVSLGAVKDMAPVLNRSSIFCSLQEENYPSQSLLEAMAAENAVIVTDVGETRKLVNGVNGLLVPKNSPEALAKAIELLTKDEAARKRLGKLAADYVKSHHTIEKFAEYLECLWREVEYGFH